VQNSAVYRTCRECLLLGASGKPLPHCPRAACSATGVKVGKTRCHASGGTLEPHYVVVEGGGFAIKFSKKKARAAPRPRAQQQQQQGAAGGGAAGAAAALG
jgi:hypothetical protein